MTTSNNEVNENRQYLFLLIYNKLLIKIISTLFYVGIYLYLFLSNWFCRILLSIQIMIIYHQYKNHKWISLYIRILNNNFNNLI